MKKALAIMLFIVLVCVIPVKVSEGQEITESTTEVATIGDSEVPMGIVDEENEEFEISWWWIGIIVLAGVAGIEMYRIHTKNNEDEI